MFSFVRLLLIRFLRAFFCTFSARTLQELSCAATRLYFLLIHFAKGGTDIVHDNLYGDLRISLYIAWQSFQISACANVRPTDCVFHFVKCGHWVYICLYICGNFYTLTFQFFYMAHTMFRLDLALLYIFLSFWGWHDFCPYLTQSAKSHFANGWRCGTFSTKKISEEKFINSSHTVNNFRNILCGSSALFSFSLAFSSSLSVCFSSLLPYRTHTHTKYVSFRQNKHI